jgi:hypothetical protein
MIQDKLAMFASAQSGTLSAAHTDIIDTLAAGNDYEGAFFVFQVSTAFTQTGTATRLTVQLQTSAVEAFNDSSDLTLVQSNAFTTAQLAAGKFFAVRIPPGAKRYIRAYNSVSGNSGDTHKFTAGAWNSFITSDIDVEINKRYMIGQY